MVVVAVLVAVVVDVVGAVVVTGVVAVMGVVGVIAAWARKEVINSSVANGGCPWTLLTKEAAIHKPLFNKYQVASAFCATTVTL